MARILAPIGWPGTPETKREARKRLSFLGLPIWRIGDLNP